MRELMGQGVTNSRFLEVPLCHSSLVTMLGTTILINVTWWKTGLAMIYNSISPRLLIEQHQGNIASAGTKCQRGVLYIRPNRHLPCTNGKNYRLDGARWPQVYTCLAGPQHGKPLQHSFGWLGFHFIH